MLALLDFANHWIEKFGVAGLGVIVFAETGLLVGFFLPGDSLLFFAGFLASDAAFKEFGHHYMPALPWVALTCAVCAFVGDQVGYFIGHRFGPTLFQRPKSRFFNPANVVKSQAFFDKYGSKTIVLARFVPIVRTFTPTVAGVSKMHYRSYVTFSVIAALLWGAGVTTLGYFLGEINFIKKNIEYAAVVIVAISISPIALEYWRHKRKAGPAITASIVED